MEEDGLSLYFELKEGEKADLEIVAQAALHWVAALRAAAIAIEPDAQFRVEFIDAKASSLRVNTLLDWMETTLTRIEVGSGKHPRLRRLAVALAVFIVSPGATHYVEDFLDGEPPTSLSDEDRGLLLELLERTRAMPDVESESRKVF